MEEKGKDEVGEGMSQQSSKQHLVTMAQHLHSEKLRIEGTTTSLGQPDASDLDLL